MQIKVKKTNPKAILPTYQTAQAAAMDAHALLDEPRVLQPMERAAIPTGVAYEIPEGYEMQVRARSGLSAKFGLALVNGVGTIDADYRGELFISLINLGQEPFTVEPEMRIAQLVIAKCDQVTLQEVDELSETERGVSGFGSTGFDKKTGND